MNVRILLALCLALSTFSCATITRGTSDAWIAETEPTGATVTLSNGLICVTPCALLLKRKYGFTATIEKDGYETVMATIVPKQSGAGSAGMAGNIFVGVVGAGLDAGSGAMKNLAPNPLVVKLVPAPDDARRNGAKDGPRNSNGYREDGEFYDGVDTMDEVFLIRTKKPDET